MNRSPSLRAFRAGLALGAAMLVAGCMGDYEGGGIPKRALAPLKPETLALLEDKGMTKDSPMVVRIFKQENELEVWKPVAATGRYELFKTYPICRWSGELGPKLKEGDRQAPEGFYTITPGLMNPHSQYYLAFNMGFPNAFDAAHGRTGAHLMVHGDCSSRGCYAMTDEQMAEIYALGREAFTAGQRSFQVQAYPFRMTPANLARHRNNPHIAFWRTLKEGNDHFLLTRQEVAYNVCEKRYVFNATPTNPAARFDPAGRCPAYEVPAEIAQAVEAQRAEDEAKVVAFAAAGKEIAPARTGRDGGMHPVFLAQIRPSVEETDDRGERRVFAGTRAPGTVPAHAVPPGERNAVAVASAPAEPRSSQEQAIIARASLPDPQRPATQVAAATPSRPQTATSSGGNWFTRMFSGGSDTSTTASTPAQPVATPQPRPTATAATAPARAAPAPAPTARPAAAPAAAQPAQGGFGLASVPRDPQAPRPGAIQPVPGGQPSATPPRPATQQAQSSSGNGAGAGQAPAFAPPPSGGLLTGSAPVLGTGSFAR